MSKENKIEGDPIFHYKQVDATIHLRFILL